MKGYVRIVLVATLLLLSTALLAGLTISPLWPSGNTWKVSNKTGPTIITKPGGNMLFLSSDGALYELSLSGALTSYGQVTGIANVVAPAAYVEALSNKYVVYVTAQSTDQNKLVVHQAVSAGTVYSENITSSAYGVTVQANTSNLLIYTATMDGTVYKMSFNSSGFTATDTVNVSGPVKVPPVLSQNGSSLYVLTQNGAFYEIGTSIFSSATKKIQLDGEFTVPMAMDESGHLYALNLSGVLYKIDPSGTAEHVATGLGGSDSAGVLIDGDGYIYVFGNGKVVVMSPNMRVKVAEYSTGNQRIKTTPAVVKGDDGITYIIVPSSLSNGTSSMITILAFDPMQGTLTETMHWEMSGSFPISAAVGVAPLASLMGDDYYFATATNDGTVYAWSFNARGPYGIWATYGQNSNHTGFIDATASLFKTRIKLIAKEGFYGKELGSSFMNSDYGLLYDATVLNADNSPATSMINLRTNEQDLSKIPEGVPGSQKLEVEFATSTVSTLLFKDNFKNIMKGGNPPATDSEFQFRMWKVGDSQGYEGIETDNPATLTYKFNDRTVNLFTDATYTFYVYHKYPLTNNSEATTTSYGFFDYGSFKNNPQAATKIIPASTTHANQEWYAYKWKVYQWDPDKLSHYEELTYKNKDNVELFIKGPAYIEIYYAQLSATITLLLPDFAYGKTRAYMFLDAATDAIAYTIEATTLQGITIDSVESEEFYGTNVGGRIWESPVTSNHLKYVVDNIQNPSTSTTRVATLVLNLSFPNDVDFAGVSDDLFEEYFDIYGYAQIRTQLTESQDLRARNVYKVNNFLYVLGDFDDDFDVDINDWNSFVDKYGETVSGADLVYNIGKREGFTSPYPNYINYRAGKLLDGTNKVNEEDLYIFGLMFGFTVPESLRVQ